MLFGVIDVEENSILQHTSMNLPWRQVKILAYLLQIHVISHEADNGRITLFENAVQPMKKEIPTEVKGGVANPERYWAKMRKLYEEFLAENPEIESAQPK